MRLKVCACVRACVCAASLCPFTKTRRVSEFCEFARSFFSRAQIAMPPRKIKMAHKRRHKKKKKHAHTKNEPRQISEKRRADRGSTKQQQPNRADTKNGKRAAAQFVMRKGYTAQGGSEKGEAKGDGMKSRYEGWETSSEMETRAHTSVRKERERKRARGRRRE